MSKQCFVCGKKVGFFNSCTTSDKKHICNDDINRLFNKPNGKSVSLRATNWASKHSAAEIKEQLNAGKIVYDEYSPKPFYKKVWFWVVVVIALTFIGSLASGSNSDSSSSSTAKSEQSSKGKESESEKVDKLKVKNTCKAINQEIAQHQELQGFKLKPSGDQFTVVVPSTATSLSDNQQKSVYQSLLKLIYEYDNGTNQGTFVEFQDQMGNPIARSSYTGSGEVKLMK